MTSESITALLQNAVASKEMKQTLKNLNAYFYNRKHENQIRDTLSIILNNTSSYHCLTEFPKRGNRSAQKGGAVDLSIYCNDLPIATIELKHQYPKDLNYLLVNKTIVADMLRCIEYPTSHFILILQHRSLIKEPPFPSSIKFLERNSKDISFYLSLLESTPLFPKKYSQVITPITVTGDYLESTYYFVIYTLAKD